MGRCLRALKLCACKAKLCKHRLGVLSQCRRLAGRGLRAALAGKSRPRQFAQARLRQGREKSGVQGLRVVAQITRMADAIAITVSE